MVGGLVDLLRLDKGNATDATLELYRSREFPRAAQATQWAVPKKSAPWARLAGAAAPANIVSKRLGSRYRSGRSKDWLKFKNPNAPAVKREAEEDWGK
jgi:hypothetical protein